MMSPLYVVSNYHHRVLFSFSNREVRHSSISHEGRLTLNERPILDVVEVIIIIITIIVILVNIYNKNNNLISVF